MDSLLVVLPTGRWLAKQRDRHSQSVGQVASALNRHPSTIRALERNNRVIPPGWSDDLRKLGLRLPAPAWPSNMTPYFGSDLKRDLSTCVGFRRSRFWLSKQLCVSEEAVLAVIRGNLVVPHDWLLKLAELGANVPDVVRSTLHQPVAAKTISSAAPAPAHVPELQDLSALLTQVEGRTPDHEPPTSKAQELPQQGRVGDLGEPPVDDSNSRRSVGELPTESTPHSLSIKWSKERGLRVKFCTNFVEQITDRLKQLLSAYQSGWHNATPSRESLKTEEPGHG